MRATLVSLGLALLFISGCSGADAPTYQDQQTTEQGSPDARLHGATTVTAPANSATAASGFHFASYSRYSGLEDRGVMTSYEALVVGDINGDRRDDVVALPSQSEIHVFLQNDSGSLNGPRIWTNGPWNQRLAKAIVLADFNGDGVNDVATNGIPSDGVGTTILVLLRGPDGNLTLKENPGSLIGYSGRHWLAADVDRDGHMDIAAFYDHVWEGMACPPGSYYCATMDVAFGDGRGGFVRKETHALGEPRLVKGANTLDTSGDGLPDITYFLEPLKTVVDPQPGRLVTRAILRAGGLGPPRTLLTSAEWGAIPVVADFNRDSRLDAVSIESQFSQIAKLQAADGTFVSAYEVPTYALRSDGVAADFDGDDALDLATIQMEWSSFGGGTFAAVNLQRNGVLTFPTRSQNVYMLDKVARHAPALGAADLNSDGCMDLAVAVGYEGIVFLRGAGCAPPARPTTPDESGFKERMN